MWFVRNQQVNKDLKIPKLRYRLLNIMLMFLQFHSEINKLNAIYHLNVTPAVTLQCRVRRRRPP